MDKNDVNRVCDIKDTIKLLSTINLSMNDLIENINSLAIELQKVASNYSEMETESVRNEEDIEDKMSLLTEIVQKAEDWDYGLKSWRTLETKQDLIAAIRKEVLDVW